MQPRYIIITPVRNEEKYIQQTMDSVLAQTMLPEKWIIVNDGSTDRTANIINDYSKWYSMIQVIHKRDRGARIPGTGVIEAFNTGYKTIADKEWEFLVKLDSDLSFKPDYFEKCLANFQQNLKLGIGGGSVYTNGNGVHRIEKKGDPIFHVRGASKIYRRECWQILNGLYCGPGWDTIDEIKANMHGWQTETFADLHIIHHRHTGAAAAPWKNWVKNGQANYITGYHPLFMILKCLKRVFRVWPFFVESFGLAYGYFSHHFKKAPRVDDREFINYVQRQQLNKLMFRKSLWQY